MLLIVGIGASAGGLEAFKSFFSAMPADTGMAFVLVQHLSPDHKSMLAELLGKTTRMDVIEAHDGVAVKPDCVFVIPPDATMTIVDGRLKIVRPAPPRDRRRPIDTFFQSLGEDQGENAIGIILSGTGSDGAQGLATVKELGGFTLAQAEYDHHALPGMPESASATGLVDEVLAVEAMPERIISYRAHLANVAAGKDGEGVRQDAASHLSAILRALHARTGHDFSEYKEKTLVRRLQRRMQVLQVETPEDYMARLSEHPEELDSLLRELLIGVTQFFRDPAAFDALGETVLKRLVAGKGAEEEIRVWVPGCASGEEAYTIAILLREAMDARRPRPKVQIFGTDLDERAIAVARVGRYRAPIAGLSPERAERWFTVEGEDRCIAPEIREMCIFSVHSVTKHPPFSKLDLISCRNLLIYLDAPMQERVMRTFHYGLKPNGTLFLGSSESVTRATKLFGVRDKKHRIFERRDAPTSPLPPFGTAQAHERPTPEPHAALAEDRIDKSVRRVMEKHYPPHLVLDRANHIVRFSGGAMGQYLEPAPGAPSFALFDILRKTLRPAARDVLQQVRRTTEPVRRDDVPIRIDGKPHLVSLIAERLTEHGPEAEFIVLALHDAGPGPVRGKSSETGKSVEELQSLQQELRTTRTQLQSTIDELETANEEMKSSNEEYQSVNEELQSSNEELETSKEEMQSVNEELQTINTEIASKNEQLTLLSSDMSNLLESTEIATLFLDEGLKVRRFTRGVGEVFHFRESDIGRPITEIVSLLDYKDLQRDVKTVLRKLSSIEREVALQDTNTTFILRIRPYRTVDNVIDGVVLTLVDISERKLADEASREGYARFESLFLTSPIGMYLVDDQLRIQLVNQIAFPVFGDIEDLIGSDFVEVIHRLWSDDYAGEIVQRFRHTLKTGKPYSTPERIEQRRDRGVTEYYEWQIQRIVLPAGGYGVVCYFIDISERVLTQLSLRESEEHFRLLFDQAADGILLWDTAGKFTDVNPAGQEILGYTHDELLDLTMADVVDPGEEPRIAREIAQFESGDVVRSEWRLRRKDGSEFVAELLGRQLPDGDLQTFVRDISDRWRHEEQQELLLKEMDHRVKNLFAVVGGMVTLSARNAATPKDMAETVQGRLGALASAHQLIMPPRGPTTARQHTTLNELILRVLSPHIDPATAADASRVEIDGPEIPVGADAATNLALVVHELATNAAKYGALSVPGGRVRVSWAAPNGRLALSWEEAGGPPIKAPPKREGFGSVLARRSVKGQLAGDLVFDWKRDGLAVLLSASVERLEL